MTTEFLATGKTTDIRLLAGFATGAVFAELQAGSGSKADTGVACVGDTDVAAGTIVFEGVTDTATGLFPIGLVAGQAEETSVLVAAFAFFFAGVRDAIAGFLVTDRLGGVGTAQVVGAGFFDTGVGLDITDRGFGRRSTVTIRATATVDTLPFFAFPELGICGAIVIDLTRSIVGVVAFVLDALPIATTIAVARTGNVYTLVAGTLLITAFAIAVEFAATGFFLDTSVTTCFFSIVTTIGTGNGPKQQKDHPSQQQGQLDTPCIHTLYLFSIHSCVCASLPKQDCNNLPMCSRGVVKLQQCNIRLGWKTIPGKASCHRHNSSGNNLDLQDFLRNFSLKKSNCTLLLLL